MPITTLIVDDQADVRLLLRLLIDRANEGMVVVAEAASGQEALRRAEEHDPTVIVLDLMMPDMNGVETAARLLAERPERVVILCSAYLDERTTDLARQVGVTHFVSKDDAHDLPEIIRRAVRAA